MKAIAVAVLSLAAASTAFADKGAGGFVCGTGQAPAEFVEASYEGLQGSGVPPEPGSAVFNDRLNRLFEDGLERIGFGFWVDGQDWEIGDIAVSTREVYGHPGRQVVQAQFTNFGEPRDLGFYFERSAEGCWQIDDVAAADGWTLSLLLKYPG